MNLSPRSLDTLMDLVENRIACMEVAGRDDMAGKLIVAIIPSFAERYVSTALFEGL